MGIDRSSMAWWRGLFAALVLLALIAPPTAAPAAIPQWLQAGLCHAPGSPSTPDTGTHDTCPHCVLCQFAQIAALPPQPLAVPMPRLQRLETPEHRVAFGTGPGLDRPYASRAPPAFG
jgi:hypothetical protein